MRYTFRKVRARKPGPEKEERGTHMSYSVIRLQKFKRHDVKGLQIHNQREKESHTNPDIDEERTRENYDLHNHGKIEYKERIDEIIKKNVEPTGRKVRKDAVMQCEFIVTSDKEFFDKLEPEEKKRFFEESYKFLRDRYGKENVIHATVHFDEQTPHMHFGFVPIRDGRLAAKRIFGNKKELHSLHTDFNAHVREKGFDLQRGEPSDRKHIETTRWKVQQAKENLKEVSKDLDREKERLERLSERVEGIQRHHQRIDAIPVKEKGVIKKRVEVSKEDWDYLMGEAKSAAAQRYEIDELSRTVKNQAARIERDIPYYSDRAARGMEAERRLEQIVKAIDRLGIREDVVKEIGEMEKERQAERDRGMDMER